MLLRYPLLRRVSTPKKLPSITALHGQRGWGSMSRISEIRNNPATSFWLQNALEEALERDIVDAVNDAELLLSLLREHLDKIMLIEKAKNV